MKNKLKGTNGITLIALVITIIVLLILAGVSIATLTGDNGILTQAQNSKTTSERAEIIERAKLDVVEIQAGNEGKITETQLNEILAKYGTVSGEGENKIITTANGHTIKVSEIYNGALTAGQGVAKTIAELYDGYNDSTDTENYDENAMHIGDYVNYTAGNWTEGKEAPTEDTPFEFGGYTAGQSRDTNASGSYTYTSGDVTYGEGKYEGWRIWDISEDKQTITLISAGCPEVYYHPYGPNYAYNTEKILTGETSGTIDSTKPSTPRVWGDYVNETRYGNSARALKKSDLDTWYGKYIDSNVNDLYEDVDEFPLNTEDKLISTVENGYFYWLSSARNHYNVSCVRADDRDVSNGDGYASVHGVRVLVTLSSEVKFNETPEKIEQDGFSYNKWTIK